MKYPANERQGRVFAADYLRWVMESGAAKEIGPEALAVLTAVVMREDDTRYQRPVNFFNEQLADRCGITSVHSLIRARSRAIEAGLLHYEPSAKRRPGRYFVCGFYAQCAGKAEGKRKESARNPQPSSPKPLPSPKPIPEEGAASGGSLSKGKNGIGYPDDFSRFWEAYPRGRRSGKQAALKAWRDAIKTTDPETLIAAAERYAASPVGRGDFCKGPAPWLNQGCWEDAPEAWGTRNGSPPSSLSSVPDRRPVTLAELKAQGERPS